MKRRARAVFLVFPWIVFCAALFSFPATGTERCRYTFNNTKADFLAAFGDMTDSGTLPFVTSPAPCLLTYWGGVWSAANHYNSPADLDAFLTGRTAYEITIGCVRFNTLVNPVMWQTDDPNTFLQVLANGQFRFCSGDVTHILASSVGAVTTGVSYKFAVRVVGAARTLKINDVSVSTDSFGTALAAFTTQIFGYYPSAAVDGYMQNFSIDDTTPTATYTKTSTATPSITQTSTITKTKTPTPSRTSTPSITATSTITPLYSPTFTKTRSGTITKTPTPTPTNTPTYTRTRTYSITPTQSRTWTRTQTPTRTLSFTMSPTYITNTYTQTLTPTPTLTYTASVTRTPFWTPHPTPEPVPTWTTPTDY